MKITRNVLQHKYELFTQYKSNINNINTNNINNTNINKANKQNNTYMCCDSILQRNIAVYSSSKKFLSSVAYSLAKFYEGEYKGHILLVTKHTFEMERVSTQVDDYRKNRIIHMKRVTQRDINYIEEKFSKIENSSNTNINNTNNYTTEELYKQVKDININNSNICNTNIFNDYFVNDVGNNHWIATVIFDESTFIEYGDMFSNSLTKAILTSDPIFYYYRIINNTNINTNTNTNNIENTNTNNTNNYHIYPFIFDSTSIYKKYENKVNSIKYVKEEIKREKDSDTFIIEYNSNTNNNILNNDNNIKNNINDNSNILNNKIIIKKYRTLCEKYLKNGIFDSNIWI
ncbi:hypothetical protein EHP00_2172 [Ecytonucleospora hepatopenaei]|uniref:Uncharacterized protein n=1 Tax=Ecytonucleospora hepatopenaei TaxID=646526 RepID=A0A1W0E594_9MICR|nr:hypothetical protein EHP00_2172 [Ecytonucleospora hepatopenaei]